VFIRQEIQDSKERKKNVDKGRVLPRLMTTRSKMLFVFDLKIWRFPSVFESVGHYSQDANMVV